MSILRVSVAGGDQRVDTERFSILVAGRAGTDNSLRNVLWRSGGIDSSCSEHGRALRVMLGNSKGKVSALRKETLL
jgi:hypothetical protein